MFKGSGVALVTPIRNNEIDYEALDNLVDFHLCNKTDAIIVCGTTGEAATMTYEERCKVIERVVKRVNKRIPVIAGTGSNSTKKAIDLSQDACNMKADALLIVTPFYNKCTQDGLYEHYKEIAKNTKLPIILYNVPSRTGVNIEPETVQKLSKISNIVGLKEASGNISKTTEIFSLIDDDFSVYSGNDDQIVPILSLGGKGVISVLANIYPELVHNMCDNYFNGNVDVARKMQLENLKLIKALFSEVNPIPVKDAMNILGYHAGEVRLPLTPATKETHEKLKKLLKK